MLTDLTSEMGKYNLDTTIPKTVLEDVVVVNRTGQAENISTFATTGDSLLPPSPKKSTSTTEENVIHWSRQFYYKDFKEEINGTNPDVFELYLQNKFRDKWPNAIPRPLYRIDDMWNATESIKHVFTTNGTLSTFNQKKYG
jgi:hypothetical protein